MRLSARGSEVTVSAGRRGRRRRTRRPRRPICSDQLAALHAAGRSAGTRRSQDRGEPGAATIRAPIWSITSSTGGSRPRPRRPSFRSRSTSAATSRRSASNDLVFGIGPAGTGKTYLAVAMAVSLLNAAPGQAHHPGPAGGRGRRAARASSPATSPPRSIRTCGRSTTRCTTCSSPTAPSGCSSRARSRSRRWRSCAGARWTIPS